MRQRAFSGRGHSAHSPPQMEWLKANVDDKLVKVGGKQCVTMLDGFVAPLGAQQGLPHVSVHPCADEELTTLPHVITTHESEWSPSVIDHDQPSDQGWCDQQSPTPLMLPMHDECGEPWRCLEA